MRFNSHAAITVSVIFFLLMPVGYELFVRLTWLYSLKGYHRDQVVGFMKDTAMNEVYDWEEHPNHKFTMITNNMGFRENLPSVPEKEASTKRIIVTGDSHIDGLVNNNESFPNRLEHALNMHATKGRYYDVVNASCGYYSFKQYAGILTRCLPLHPDHFVVTVYTGNDFLESLLYDRPLLLFAGAYKHFWYRIQKNVQLNRVSRVKSQSLNQLLYFKLYPADTVKAMHSAKYYFTQIIKTCKRNNIKLTVVFLPAKPDVETDLFIAWQHSLQWTTDDLLLNRILSVRLRSFLEQQQVKTLDLLVNENSEVKLFYDSDHHLNVDGHKVIAEELFDRSYLFE